MSSIADEDPKEESLPFLIFDPNKKAFTLTEQGEEVIRSLTGEFGVISVAGMYRTGKSYLLNRMLLNRQKGFSVGPTVNPCTKGLWIWSKPIYGSGEGGKRLPVLIIDTEGFGALDEDSNHDIRIFTLAILLSSYFVYNSMGSIDENALQNLNFVINVSKYIHMRKGETETEPEELANLFPSFLWVVRDFTLKLVDDNDENITPKEYLEKVLDWTKSVNDPKNKIRKLIKAYFKDRDCFTMYRPLTNEQGLQNLEEMEPERLRPEFLEQILQLRKKVLSRVKVKTLNGKALNSEMYLNLIKSLVDSLNSGKVPTIESTWMSMCKVESYRAFEEAEQVYENFLKDNIGCYDETLESIHKEAKERAMEVFNKKALGDVAGEFAKQLKAKIKEKYSYYAKLQDEESKGKIIRVLNKWYSILESRIQNNDFKSIEEIGNDFISLEEKLNETFPNYGNRAELFNEFKTRVFSYAGEYFAVKAENEKRFLEEQANQKIMKLMNDMDNMKSNYEKENEKKKILLDQNKTEITDLKDEIVQLREKLAVNEKEKEIASNNMNSQFNRMKEDFIRKLKDSETKRSSNEESLKDAERKVITIQAECEKEKALLNQKNDHLQKLIDDYAKREKETTQEMKSQLKEQSIAFKDKSDKYEKTIKTLAKENDLYKERILDLESNYQESEIQVQSQKKNLEELTQKATREIKDLNQKLSELKKTSNEEREKLKSEYTTKENDYTSQIRKLKLKINEIEINKKTIEDTSMTNITKMERQIAILKQENSLLKSQNSELNSRVNEQKQYYENIISNLENKAFSVDHEEFQKKIDEIKIYYDEEKKKTEENFEKTKSNLIAQVDKLTENLNRSELNVKNLKNDISHLKSESKAKIDKLTKENSEMQKEKTELNKSLKANTNDLNEKLKKSQRDLEKKLEEKEISHQQEICELNKNSEETLNQLKALFETEKIRLEEKLKEEKSKNARKVAGLIEDYELKLKDQESELKEENERIQNDLNDLEKEYYASMANTERQIEIAKEKIESSEKALKESKDSIAALTEQNKNTIDQLNDQIAKERKESQNKIDAISNELNEKEKTLAGVISKKDQLEKIIKEKDDNINTLKLEHIKEKSELNSKYDDLKSKFNDLNDNSMKKHLESSRDNALLTQQIEFLNKKNEEAKKASESNQKRYEERLFALRAEVEKDLNEKFERLKTDKKELEAKLLSKKKEIKELEQSFTRSNQMVTKEKNELYEKVLSMQKTIDELNEVKNADKEKYEKQLYALTVENNTYKSNLGENEKSMKNKIADLEAKLLEKTSQYEKDQILWDGKIKFIEQERDNLKKEQVESNKRFENMIQSIQKKGNLEKEKLESSTKTAIANLEQKYQKQIKDIQENHNILYSKLLQNNKELERELKSVRLENQMNKNKTANPLDLSKQMDEFAKEKEKLKQSHAKLKSEHEIKVSELTNAYEKEKGNLKKKIADIEKNLREAEGKRGALLLELEKEKAKWEIEKDNMMTKNGELKDKLVSLEKKNESLTRENERLKSDKTRMRKESAKKESKYSMLYKDPNLEGSNLIPNPSNRYYMNFASNYQNKMFKILGDLDSRVDTENNSVMSKDLNKSTSSKGKSDTKSINADNYEQK